MVCYELVILVLVIVIGKWMIVNGEGVMGEVIVCEDEGKDCRRRIGWGC